MTKGEFLKLVELFDDDVEIGIIVRGAFSDHAYPVGTVELGSDTVDIVVKPASDWPKGAYDPVDKPRAAYDQVVWEND